MTQQAWIPAVLFLLALAMLPLALKWLQRRVAGGASQTTGTVRIVSAVGVGPHQRVVTVEVGPQGQRTWLTLGVTQQTITCLHSAPAEPEVPPFNVAALTGSSTP